MTVSKVLCDCGQVLQYEWFVCDCSPCERAYFVIKEGTRVNITKCPKCNKDLQSPPPSHIYIIQQASANIDQKMTDSQKKIRDIVTMFKVPIAELAQLVQLAKDEVEVPDCSDCTHKRFHDNRGGRFE